MFLHQKGSEKLKMDIGYYLGSMEILIEVQRSGYDYQGWYTKASGGTNIFNAINAGFNVIKDIDYTSISFRIPTIILLSDGEDNINDL